MYNVGCMECEMCELKLRFERRRGLRKGKASIVIIVTPADQVRKFNRCMGYLGRFDNTEAVPTNGTNLFNTGASATIMAWYSSIALRTMPCSQVLATQGSRILFVSSLAQHYSAVSSAS